MSKTISNECNEPVSILQVYDQLKGSFFLPDAERVRMLDGYNPAVERLGVRPGLPGSPADAEYMAKYGWYMAALCTQYKPVLDRLILDIAYAYPKQDAGKRLGAIPRDALFALSWRLEVARSQLARRHFPDIGKGREGDLAAYSAVCFRYMAEENAAEPRTV